MASLSVTNNVVVRVALFICLHPSVPRRPFGFTFFVDILYQLPIFYPFSTVSRTQRHPNHLEPTQLRTHLANLNKMVKFIPKLELTLQRASDAQKAEIEELRAEVERLKVENVRLSKLAFGKQSNNNNHASKVLTTETPSSMPSYLRPTASSMNRAVKSITPEDSETVDDRAPMYVDGKLVRIKGKPRPHYTAPTQASLDKSGEANWGDWDSPSEEEKTLWKTYSNEQPTIEQTWVHYNCTRCNQLETAWKDESAHSLAARTRLDDAGVNFQQSAAACVSIPYRTQYRLLNSACRITQDVLWHHLREHWPSKQNNHCFEGPREVKLSRSELHNLIVGTDWCPNEHATSYLVRNAILDISDLRDTLAHPGQECLATVDALITRAQKLAVILLDEKRAMKLRKLRDELRITAEKAVAQTEETYYGNLGPYTPKGRQWALHHQRTFSGLIAAHKSKELWRHDPAPEIVKLAAWDWEVTNYGHAPGELNAEYVAAMESARARVTETGPATPPLGD